MNHMRDMFYNSSLGEGDCVCTVLTSVLLHLNSVHAQYICSVNTPLKYISLDSVKYLFLKVPINVYGFSFDFGVFLVIAISIATKNKY